MTNPASQNEFLLLSRGQWDADKSPQQIQAAIDAFYAWHERLVAEGRFKSGQRLAKEAKLVTRSGVVDGPFTEAKEVVGGFAMVEVKSMAEAREVARQFMEIHLKHWPEFEGECEVRPLEDM